MIRGVDVLSTYVTDDDVFSELCSQWAQKEAIGVDTEFIRTNTFYPRLGLMQVFDGEKAYLVDPLKIEDWQPFISVMIESDCVFVMHAASEDLTLFQHFFNAQPGQMFDTQIAASYCGFTVNSSYQSLVEILLKKEISKEETRSNWLQRPLTSAQCQYAATDVIYLLEMQDLLTTKLKFLDRLDWASLEFKNQLLVAVDAENTERWRYLYASFKSAWTLEDYPLAFLQSLLLWREKTARSVNKPRSWIFRDADILNFVASLGVQSHKNSVSYYTIEDIEDMPQRVKKDYGNDLIAWFNDNPPEVESISRNEIFIPLNGNERRALKVCQKVVHKIAEDLGLDPSLILNKKQLSSFVRCHSSNNATLWFERLTSWRTNIIALPLRKAMSET
ncbi:hypothetical protein N9X66_09325 [Gammaproteobacteria bacterium]|nr:hypothetical protein [Gammaproteobacteria bacterium]